MSITLIRDRLEDLLPMQGRSPGLHVSDVIRDLCLKLGHFDDQRAMNPTQLQLGCALEHAVIQRLQLDQPDRYHNVGELVEDGLYMTPDLVDVVDNEPLEIKLTWMSSRNDVASEKFWKYWVQVRCYAHRLRATGGKLLVVFANGDYKGSGPQGRLWHADFTAAGLEANWTMIQQHAAAMRTTNDS